MRKAVLIFGYDDTTHFIDILNQYTRLFDRNHYEVTVAYLTGETNAETEHRTLAEHVVFFNFSPNNVRQLKMKAIKQLLAFCREKNFQIVICHRYKPTYIMLWVAQFYSIPVLISVTHELKALASFKRRVLLACLARKNMLFAGVSDAVRDDMRQYLWGIAKERIVTLYNVLDVESFEPQLLSKHEARAPLYLSREDFIFGNFARLVPNKDQASLIHAFSLIQPYCPHAKLIIFGVGKLADQLKAQVKTLGLEDRVLFYGQVPHAFRYMKALDCFVLSSIQEAFGRVLLEAMLAKIPVIATRAHGIPEVLGETNYLVKPKDVAALALAMREMYLMSAEERQAVGEKGYEHMKAHFSLPRFQQQFWELPLLKEHDLISG